MSKSSARMRRSAVTIFQFVVVVGAAAFLLAAGGCAPPASQGLLDQLPAAQARELKVYSTNHAYVFDPRLHSMDTCPFFAYLPAAAGPNTPERAAKLHRYYSAKHREERWLGCKCEKQLLEPMDAAPAAERPADAIP